jgi:cytochrome P450
MRLYPPAWLQMRIVAKESEINGVKLPVGTLLILSQWVMHRLPEIWQDAEVFKPERWDPATEQHIPPGAYFPFGGGPRTCIGMPLAQLEAKIILASILQRYTPQPIPGYIPGFQPTITLRPKRHLEAALMPVSSSNFDARWKQLVSASDPALLQGLERQGCRNALLRIFGL